MKELVLQGYAWKFGDNVTTDDILPGQFLDRSSEEAACYLMAGVDPTFAQRIQPGDFIVAGKNFGAGSGRENAIHAIKRAGIPAVIAESFSRLFFRNAINNGLIPVLIDSTSQIKTGDRLVLRLKDRILENLTNGEVLHIRNLTGLSLEILQAGGITHFIRQRLENRTREARS